MKSFFIVVLGMICCAEICRASATDDYFAQGDELGRAGKISEAAEAFEKSARLQPSAGAFVNLGIAEWQRGHGGAAILAWEQARWIDPFDARANADLKFARQVAQLDGPDLKWFEKVSTWLPPDAWAWLAGTSLWLIFGTLLLPGIFRWRKTGWQQMLAALAFGSFLFCMTAGIGVAGRTQIGFVLKKNAPLLLTPTETGEVISVLNPGEPARQLRVRGNFLYISTGEGSGWIGQKNFQLIYE